LQQIVSRKQEPRKNWYKNVPTEKSLGRSHIALPVGVAGLNSADKMELTNAQGIWTMINFAIARKPFK
jgi:hypothetical protein